MIACLTIESPVFLCIDWFYLTNFFFWIPGLSIVPVTVGALYENVFLQIQFPLNFVNGCISYINF